MNPNFAAIKANYSDSDHVVSPAETLDIVVGYDEDGFENFRTFSAGDVVVNSSGLLFRVWGFTVDNLVIVRPHGLGHHPAFSSAVYMAVGLEHPTPAYMGQRHKDGLITLAG